MAVRIGEVVEGWIKKQHVLDQRIYTRFGMSEADYLLDHLALAFKVELCEAANEFRGFKFWSQDQEQRRELLLEELIDCVHFILSIGNARFYLHLEENVGQRLYYYEPTVSETWEELRQEKPELYKKQISHRFNGVIAAMVGFEKGDGYGEYLRTFQELLNLAALLGFQLPDLVAAYDKKNAKNHDRQGAGY